MFIEFDKKPTGAYVSKLSSLSPRMFDLMVATCNLMEEYDISSTGLLDRALDDENTAQDILSAIVNELSELESKDIVNVQFERQPFECVGYIRKESVEPVEEVTECRE